MRPLKECESVRRIRLMLEYSCDVDKDIDHWFQGKAELEQHLNTVKTKLKSTAHSMLAPNLWLHLQILQGNVSSGGGQ